MSLVMAAITPHTPLLIPSIGKEALLKLEKTVLALKKIEADLYLTRPDILLIFAPHAEQIANNFTLQQAHSFQSNLKEFGDLATHTQYKGEIPLATTIAEAAQKNNFPTRLIHTPTIHYGVVTPLLYLAAHLPKITILPIGFCEEDYKQHLDFGQFLQEQIMITNKRVAVIASIDLSHALTTSSPAGFQPAGQKFDEKLQQLLASKNTTGMIQLDPTLVQMAAECGFKNILLLMGVLRGHQYHYQHDAYESPFGVGYLTAHFTF